MPSPTLFSAGTKAQSSTTTANATVPNVVTTNKLLLWTCHANSALATITPPSGYTARHNAVVGSERICIATKTGVSGDQNAAANGTKSGTTDSEQWVDVFQDFDTAFAGTWVTVTSSGTMSTTTCLMPSLTSNVNNASLYGYWYSGGSASDNQWTVPGTMTEIRDTGGTGSKVEAYETQATAGAFGTRTATTLTATAAWSVVGLQLPGTGAATTTLTQSTFRGRNDDGSETTATWKATAGTDWTQAVDTNFRVRFNISDSVAAATQNTAFVLRYSLNGGAYTAVSGASSVVRAFASANITDGVATTEQLAGAGTFNAGTIDEVDGSALGFTAATSTGQDTEVEYVVQIRSADVVNNDVINLRVYNGTTALDAYTDTPIITVSEAAAAASLVFDKSIRTTSLLRR